MCLPRPFASSQKHPKKAAASRTPQKSRTRRVLLGLAVLAASTLPTFADCRLALVLAVDVSGSVDATEYRLQLDGIAAALQAPDVQNQLLSTPQIPVMLAVFEWSNARYHRVIIDWTALSNTAQIAQTAATLRAHNTRPNQGATAIGASMLYSNLLFQNGPDCWARTIDISGDGKNNDGPPPQRTRETPAFANTTINALVIAPSATRNNDERRMEMMDLSAYFRTLVIHGPGAFIEIAMGFEDFERAMTRKLLRETRLPQMGQSNF